MSPGDQAKWDYRFLELAGTVATWSKDPSTQCGAVVVDNQRRVISLGYNGFPRGVQDYPHRYHERNKKLMYVVHAEANALLNATASTVEATVYVHPMQPCSECAKLLIQAGAKAVVSYVPTSHQLDRWRESFRYASKMFKESGVEVRLLNQPQSGDH